MSVFKKGFSKGFALEGGSKANDFDTLEEAKKVAMENKDKVKYITKTTKYGKIKYSLRKGNTLQSNADSERKKEMSIKFEPPKKKIKIFRTKKVEEKDGKEENVVIPITPKKEGRRIKLRKKPKEEVEAKPKKKIKLKKKKKEEDEEEEEEEEKKVEKKMDTKSSSISMKKMKDNTKKQDVKDKATKSIAKNIPKIPTSKSKITKPMKAVPTADDAMKRKKK